MTSLTDSSTTDVTMHQVTTPADEHRAAVTWLSGEFPDWEIVVSTAQDGRGDHHDLFIASREGHHPQSELSPAKLHSRLSDYLDRESRRTAMMN